MKTKVRELNIPQKTKDQIQVIMNDGRFSPYYKQKQCRDILGHTFCASCHGLPELEISYKYDSIIRLQHFCKRCYALDQEREAKHPDTREEIARFYGCEVASENYFGGGKEEYKQGYSTTPKSSLSERTIICSRCGITRICFNDNYRNHNNVLIPLEYYHSMRPHDCDISLPFWCNWCDCKLYHDKKIRNDNNVLIPIQFDDDTFHVCPKKPTRKEVGYR